MTRLIIQSTSYSSILNGGIQKKSSLDEKFMYMGLGKYQRVLDQKNEFQKLIEREEDVKKQNTGICIRV